MLLEFTDKGIYCPPAKIYIDPWKPVGHALITHGHSDHSRWGHQYYMCTESAKPVIRHRLGPIKIETVKYGEKTNINGVNFTFFPAGHIIGSAQIKVEHQGEIWVVSGDYKLEDDGISEAFELVRCHNFITECTFGLPVYNWQAQETIFAEINDWWRKNQDAGKTSILSTYALGKAQRILHHLDPSIGRIYTHGAIENTNEVIRAQGISLPETIRVTQEIPKKNYPGQMVLATPSSLGTSWIKKFGTASLGIASGWMALRGARRRRAADRGFILSDHADWAGLNQAIADTGAERIFVTHGYTEIFQKWLIEEGYDAHIVSTEYEGEMNEMRETEDDASAV